MPWGQFEEILYEQMAVGLPDRTVPAVDVHVKLRVVRKCASCVPDRKKRSPGYVKVGSHRTAVKLSHGLLCGRAMERHPFVESGTLLKAHRDCGPVIVGTHERNAPAK